MSTEPVLLADCEAGLELVAVPAWVIEIEPTKIIWANEPALELWHARTRAELYARDMDTGAPEKVRARVRHIVEQVCAGKVLREEWAFYPRGEAIMVLVDFRAVTLSDGRLGVLNQALPIVDAAPPSLRRAITMSRHSSVMSAFVDADGGILSKNPAALLAFGEMRSWTSWLSDRAQAEEILRRVAAGETVRTQAQVAAGEESRWHVIEAQALRDPVTGELGVLVEHSDETARIEAEQLADSRSQRIDALSATLRVVEQQRREILALSAPLLDVGDRTLAVPIIGRLSETQTGEIMAKILDAVAAHDVRHVILDLTGMPEVDERSAARLRQLVRALRLLGATPTITGIRPELALALTSSGFDLEGVATLRSLAEGLRRRGQLGK
jgi:rsbT co-antagonist protein RsbR